MIKFYKLSNFRELDYSILPIEPKTKNLNYETVLEAFRKLNA